MSLPVSNAKIRVRRVPQIVLFVSFIAWYFGSGALAESAANGLALRFRMVTFRSLLEACFHLFLLVIGFGLLDVLARQAAPVRDLMALPVRQTAGREWMTGAALGWGMVVAALLPAVVLGRVHTEISPGFEEILVSVLSLAALVASTLAHEIAFRGYPFRCLTGAVGDSGAVILMVLGAGISTWHKGWIPGIAVLASMLLTLLLSISWLRTRAVWLAWGLHFSLVASGSVLFGWPVGGGEGGRSLVRSTAYGPEWLAGGLLGPAAAFFSIVVLVVSIFALYRVTRDYAWSYTHVPILAGGYEVSVAPPAPHVAMEKQAAEPALVQIASITPKNFSTHRPGDNSPGRP